MFGFRPIRFKVTHAAFERAAWNYLEESARLLKSLPPKEAFTATVSRRQTL